MKDKATMSKETTPEEAMLIDQKDYDSDAERIETTFGPGSPTYPPDDLIPTPQTSAPAIRYSLRTEKRAPTDKHLPELGPPKKKRGGNPVTRQMEVLTAILEAVERQEAQQAAARAQQTALLEKLVEMETNNAARLERLIALSHECQTRIGVAETRIQTLQEARRDEATQQPAVAGTSTQTHPTTPHVIAPPGGGGETGLGFF